MGNKNVIMVNSDYIGIHLSDKKCNVLKYIKNL